MKSIHWFLAKAGGFFGDGNFPMRHRILAAPMPCTCRNHSRKGCRIPSPNRKAYKPSFITRMTCAMGRENRPFQGFLLAFELDGNWSFE